MIGSLRGRLLDRGLASPVEVLVEVGGIGYRVLVTPATAVAVGDVGDEVLLYTHHHHREDAELLYGFPTVAERAGFEVMLRAPGVGPSLALAILAVHSVDSLRRALADNDVAALCLVPGVGRKTAARLLVELKSRLDVADFDDLGPAGATITKGGTAPANPRADVRDALTGLGYAPDEIREVLADLPDEGDSALLLKQALQRLALVRR
jgi:holliday junction DNA helicase RuvA